MKDMITDLLMFYKYGGKNLYYFNTYDGQEDTTLVFEKNEQDLANDALEEIFDEEDDCSSCKL